MVTTQFCDRYRERNVPNPREMLALRNTKVDLSKWEPVSFGLTPPSRVGTLAAKGFVILERARRWYRAPRIHAQARQADGVE
jgi:hypothetical protein